MPIKVLLKMVPKRVWVALGGLCLGCWLGGGFAGAALYDVVF